MVGLEGSSDISIITKRYPRIGPAEAGTGYEEQTESFAANNVPTELPIFRRSDELIIHVKGKVSQPDLAPKLKAQIHELVGQPEIGLQWDVRWRFKALESSHAYQFTFFTNSVPRDDRVDLA
jgi:hypothetical protein